jgi:hypothetical protein
MAKFLAACLSAVPALIQLLTSILNRMNASRRTGREWEAETKRESHDLLLKALKARRLARKNFDLDHRNNNPDKLRTSSAKGNGRSQAD